MSICLGDKSETKCYESHNTENDIIETNTRDMDQFSRPHMKFFFMTTAKFV